MLNHSQSSFPPPTCASAPAKLISAPLPVLGFPISMPLRMMLPYPLGLKYTHLSSPAQTSLFQEGFPDYPSWDDCSFSETLYQYTVSPPSSGTYHALP